MRRNLISNRQLRVFNALLLDRLGDENCYINARQIFGRDTAIEWVELDLADGEEYAFSYAEDKPWFHRCAVMPIYCGAKGSLQGSIDFRDEMLCLIRDWGYEAAVGEPPSMHLLRIDVTFPFPRWHEEDHDDDLLDDSEITLFPELEEKAEPYTLGMTNDSWFNESADAFFQESLVETRQKGSIYNYLHDPNGRWERSLPNAHEGTTGCIISHYDSKDSLQAQSDFLPIGTFSKETKTFLWSWMNIGWLECYRLDERLREKNPGLHEMIQKIKDITHEYGYEEFANESEFGIEEFECWELTAMACKQLEADATFMLPGEYGNTYGILFYQNNHHRAFAQQAIRLMSEWRKTMKAYLDANESLYDASSLSFAKGLLQSDYATQIEKSFKEAIENEQFLDIVGLRLGDEANEERRFKETLKALLAKHNKSACT
jgi:hypothetical protein